MNDTIISKVESIQRCVFRAREEYNFDPAGFAFDFSRQDAALLNVLRACEQAIDLANHLIRREKLGIPNSSRESFLLLRDRGIIPAELADSLIRMAHFRNLLVHQYEKMDIDVVCNVIKKKLDDLIRFGDAVMDAACGNN
jgi:uncharacterized protein YutE (UPF0331/DUF86 family)